MKSALKEICSKKWRNDKTKVKAHFPHITYYIPGKLGMTKHCLDEKLYFKVKSSELLKKGTKLNTMFEKCFILTNRVI